MPTLAVLPLAALSPPAALSPAVQPPAVWRGRAAATSRVRIMSSPTSEPLST